MFKVSRDGSGFTVLHHFGDIGNDGNRPLGPLIDGNDGVLYGSTQNGGTAGQGTVFRINKDGSDYAVVRSFTTASAGGVNLFGGLIQADDGALYGTTYGGGNFNFGTVFRMLAPQRPVISSFYTASNIVQVTISGTSGYNYSLYRSTNLITWSILTNNIMPSTGTLISRDSNPPEVKAFYRVALAP